MGMTDNRPTNSGTSVSVAPPTLRARAMDILENSENTLSRVYNIKRDMFGFDGDLVSNDCEKINEDPGVNEILMRIEQNVSHANSVLDEIANKLR